MPAYVLSVLVYVQRGVDMIFAPCVLGMEAGVFQAKFVYDHDLKLVEWVQY